MDSIFLLWPIIAAGYQLSIMGKHFKPYTAEELVAVMRKKGRMISVRKAEIILQTMRKLAKLSIEQYFNVLKLHIYISG